MSINQERYRTSDGTLCGKPNRRYDGAELNPLDKGLFAPEAMQTLTPLIYSGKGVAAIVEELAKAGGQQITYSESRELQTQLKPKNGQNL